MRHCTQLVCEVFLPIKMGLLSACRKLLQVYQV